MPRWRIGLPHITAFFTNGNAQCRRPVVGLMSYCHVSDTINAPCEYPARAQPCLTMRSRCKFIWLASSSRPARMDGPIGTAWAG